MRSWAFDQQGKGGSEAQQRLALLALGSIGRTTDLSSYSDVQPVITGCLQLSILTHTCCASCLSSEVHRCTDSILQHRLQAGTCRLFVSSKLRLPPLVQLTALRALLSITAKNMW